MVGLGIVRQSKANALDVAHVVKKEAVQVNENLPEGMQLIQSYDTSVFNDVFPDIETTTMLGFRVSGKGDVRY